MDTKKYIIEIPDNTAWLQWVKVSDKDGHVCFDFKYPEDLTPYIEPDLDAVKKEVHDKCMSEAEDLAYKLYSPKIDEAYQRGLNDAWDAARKIACGRPHGGFHIDTKQHIFGAADYAYILANYSASEAVEKIQKYEDEQKEQEKLPTVEDVMRQYLDTFCKNRICSDCPLYTSEFTCGRGNHFCTNRPVSNEEVRRAYAKVLKNMKE